MNVLDANQQLIIATNKFQETKKMSVLKQSIKKLQKGRTRKMSMRIDLTPREKKMIVLAMRYYGSVSNMATELLIKESERLLVQNNEMHLLEQPLIVHNVHRGWKIGEPNEG